LLLLPFPDLNRILITVNINELLIEFFSVLQHFTLSKSCPSRFIEKPDDNVRGIKVQVCNAHLNNDIIIKRELHKGNSIISDPFWIAPMSNLAQYDASNPLEVEFEDSSRIYFICCAYSSFYELLSIPINDLTIKEFRLDIEFSFIY
jgi:hypothetical protein